MFYTALKLWQLHYICERAHKKISKSAQLSPAAALANQSTNQSLTQYRPAMHRLSTYLIIVMADGSTIRYLYTAAGAKLSEIAITADGDTLSRRDYVSNLEITAKGDSLPDRRILLAEGYITLADTTFHAYIPDYQGNIIAVYNTKTDEIEQQTDYYPYGLPHADTEASAPQSTRRKYGAKELMTDHGLNLYDFEARHYNPVFPLFSGVDIMSEKEYYGQPYAYCSCDPVNYFDPTGLFKIANIQKGGAYQAIYVLQLHETLGRDNGKGQLVVEEKLRDLYLRLNSEKLPIVFAENIKDFSNAMAKLKEMNIDNNIYVLTSHGESGAFSIGDDRISSETDLSLLKNGIQGKTVIINACSVAEGVTGENFIVKLAKELYCGVFASVTPLNSKIRINNGVYELRFDNSIKNKVEREFLYSTCTGNLIAVSNLTVSTKSGIGGNLNFSRWTEMTMRRQQMTNLMNIITEALNDPNIRKLYIQLNN